jgi:glycosyltransferase involved in cell wall biosynthesis
MPHCRSRTDDSSDHEYAEPFISVIIPHLNQPEHLGRCLQSLQRQSYPAARFEIVVVDNGSKALPTSVIEKHSNARLEQESSPGPGPARNRGVAVARGPLLAFIDADCIADERWLAIIASTVGSKKSWRAIGGDVRIAVRDPMRFTQLEAYESIFAYRQEEYIRKLGFSGTGNLAMHREDFASVGPFGGIEVAEDREWGRRAKALGLQIQYAPDMIVYHPARVAFSELYKKWDRHIAHDASDFANLRFGLIRWIMYAIAVAVSPVLELRRILASARVPSLRARWQATIALVRIRVYRARCMVRHAYLLTRGQGPAGPLWNKE